MELRTLHANTMKIQVIRKNNYGTEVIYAKEIETARLLRVLTGNKTLSLEKIGALKKLGHTFEDVTPKVEI